MRARRPGGFTLLELLVVLLLIGIISTYAMLSIGDRAVGDRLENEARRLAQLMQLASEESQVKGVIIGFEPTLDGYRFVTPGSDGGWVSYAEDRGPFRPRKLNESFEMELRVEGRLVPPPTPEAEARDEDSADEASAPQPAMLMLPSGERTPFELRVEAASLDQYQTVTGGPLGAIERKLVTPEQ